MPDDRHVRLMQRAIALSAEHMAAGAGGPFGAVIAQGEAIVGEGWNQVTSVNDPTAHAEIVAIRAAARRLQRFELAGTELYTSCEPCPMCLAAAYWARVDRVWYANTREDAAAIGFDDAVIYAEVGLPIEGRRLPMTPLLRNEAYRVFEEWLRKADRVMY
jgi:guanine deaminase